jgi:transcriptional regulator with XRE-family HTH domain
MKESFGEYVRKLRTDRGMTLTQLAARLNMDSANLSKIETGKRDFDERKLERLSKIFKLNLENVKVEFFSEKIAKDLFKYKCSGETLLLAEQKVKYIKQRNQKQGQIEF